MNEITHEQSHPLGIGKNIANVFKNSLSLLSQTMELLAIETRLAGLSIAMIIASAIGIVLLSMAIWLLLIAAIAFAMVTAGYGWGATLLSLALLNLCAIFPLLYAITKLSKNLLFRFSRKQASLLTTVGANNHAPT